MHTRTQRTRFTLTVPVKPLCPGCGHVINADAWLVRHDTLFCYTCGLQPDAPLWSLTELLSDRDIIRHTRSANGVTCWTPDDTYPVGTGLREYIARNARPCKYGH